MPRPRKQTNLIAPPSTQVSTFVRSLEAEEYLQCSSDHLIAHIPFWQYGIHYRDMRKPSSSKADYRWNVKAIDEWFNTPPELRTHKISPQISPIGKI
jgi:hypothetical protein